MLISGLVIVFTAKSLISMAITAAAVTVVTTVTAEATKKAIIGKNRRSKNGRY